MVSETKAAKWLFLKVIPLSFKKYFKFMLSSEYLSYTSYDLNFKMCLSFKHLFFILENDASISKFVTKILESSVKKCK